MIDGWPRGTVLAACVADDVIEALFGRARRANRCPVSGVKQPCRRNLETAEFDRYC
jgi:hypothetical protein